WIMGMARSLPTRRRCSTLDDPLSWGWSDDDDEHRRTDVARRRPLARPPGRPMDLSMLDVLRRIEEDLPRLLREEAWTSLDVEYEPPRVERLWRQLGDVRVNLHRIHPCPTALYHPHPWPSAVKILSGVYEMGVGYGVGSATPPTAVTLRLGAGQSYEMIEPNGWHYVRPIGGPSLSLMVTGRPWDLHHLGEKRPHGTLHPLSEAAASELLGVFRALYP